jgi:hypothetical protein
MGVAAAIRLMWVAAFSLNLTFSPREKEFGTRGVVKNVPSNYDSQN